MEITGQSEEVLTLMLNNERHTLESLRVKPHVPLSGYFLSGGKL